MPWRDGERLIIRSASAVAPTPPVAPVQIICGVADLEKISQAIDVELRSAQATLPPQDPHVVPSFRQAPTPEPAVSPRARPLVIDLLASLALIALALISAPIFARCSVTGVTASAPPPPASSPAASAPASSPAASAYASTPVASAFSAASAVVPEPRVAAPVPRAPEPRRDVARAPDPSPTLPVATAVPTSVPLTGPLLKED